MIKELKRMPWGVKIAAVFLLAVYVAICIMLPWIGIGLGVALGTFWSIMRVVHYVNFGD